MSLGNSKERPSAPCSLKTVVDDDVITGLLDNTLGNTVTDLLQCLCALNLIPATDAPADRQTINRDGRGEILRTQVIFNRTTDVDVATFTRATVGAETADPVYSLWHSAFESTLADDLSGQAIIDLIPPTIIRPGNGVTADLY